MGEKANFVEAVGSAEPLRTVAREGASQEGIKPSKQSAEDAAEVRNRLFEAEREDDLKLVDRDRDSESEEDANLRAMAISDIAEDVIQDRARPKRRRTRSKSK